MDNIIVRKCEQNRHLPEDFGCEICGYNCDIQPGGSLIAGPCGQQNCWYSCTVCEYNGFECTYTGED